jgi:hypothetical protein
MDGSIELMDQPAHIWLVHLSLAYSNQGVTHSSLSESDSPPKHYTVILNTTPV